MGRLLKVSAVLGFNVVELYHIFHATSASCRKARRSITRLGDAEVVSLPGGVFSHHAQDLIGKRVVPIVAEIRARSLSEFGGYQRHDGEEYVYVLQGSLLLDTDTYTPVHLEAGEAIYFDGTTGHAYLVNGDDSCLILIVRAPNSLLPLSAATL